MAGGNAHDRKKFEEAVEREVKKRLGPESQALLTAIPASAQLPPPKKPKSPKRKSKLHPIVRWLRTAGITAELFGWTGLLLVGWFWPAAIFIYAGFLLLVSCPGDFVSGAPPPTA